MNTLEREQLTYLICHFWKKHSLSCVEMQKCIHAYIHTCIHKYMHKYIHNTALLQVNADLLWSPCVIQCMSVESIHSWLPVLQVRQLLRLPVLHAHPVHPSHQHPGSSARRSHQDGHEEGLLPGLWLLSLDLQRRGDGGQISRWVPECVNDVNEVIVEVSAVIRWFLMSHLVSCSQRWMAGAREPSHSAGTSPPPPVVMYSHKFLTCFQTVKYFWIDAPVSRLRQHIAGPRQTVA